MAYVAGALLGVIWLWFWLRGHWFAALLGMVPGLALGAIAGQFSPAVAIAAVVAWVPFLAWKAIPRLAADFRVVAGSDQDASFVEQPPRLELR